MLNRIPLVLWQIICLLISIAFFSLILLNRQVSPLRQISVAAQIDFFPVIPITAVALYLSFRIPGRIGELIACAATISLFALPLAGLWTSGHTYTRALSGIIPIGDAKIYYVDALRLTSGMDFSSDSARRPFFSGLLAVLLFITNYDLMTSLAIFTALTGLATYMVIREIQRTHGSEVSVFVLLMIFLFFRLHSGTGMTENLGVSLGTLGFAMLWRGASDKKLWLVGLGLLTTTLALNARAGAFFTLPFFILWAGWNFPEERHVSWKAMTLSTCAIVLGFTLNLMHTKMLAVSSGVPFGNFSHSLYGLASGGKSWLHIYEVHPEILKLKDPELSRRVYQLAFELMRDQPLESVKGAIFNWKILFSDTLYSIYSYVAHENWTINPVVKWTLYFLSMIGVYDCFRDIKKPVTSLVLAGIVGIFLSVPFAPPTDTFRMRPYAASIAILGALPALGLGRILQRTRLANFMLPDQDKTQPFITVIFAAILVLTMLIGPLIIRFTSPRITFTSSSCFSNLASIVIRLDHGTFINLHAAERDFMDGAPDFHIDLFRQQAHSLSDDYIIKWAQKLPSSTTLVMTLDRLENSGVLVVIPTKLALKIGQYLQLCGSFEEDPQLQFYKDIFYVEKVLALTP